MALLFERRYYPSRCLLILMVCLETDQFPGVHIVFRIYVSPTYSINCLKHGYFSLMFGLGQARDLAIWPASIFILYDETTNSPMVCMFNNWLDIPERVHAMGIPVNYNQVIDTGLYPNKSGFCFGTVLWSLFGIGYRIPDMCVYNSFEFF